MLKYSYVFQIKYTEAILSNSTRKLLRGLKLPKCSLQFKKKINLLCYFRSAAAVARSHAGRGPAHQRAARQRLVAKQQLVARQRLAAVRAGGCGADGSPARPSVHDRRRRFLLHRSRRVPVAERA